MRNFFFAIACCIGILCVVCDGDTQKDTQKFDGMLGKERVTLTEEVNGWWSLKVSKSDGRSVEYWYHRDQQTCSESTILGSVIVTRPNYPTIVITAKDSPVMQQAQKDCFNYLQKIVMEQTRAYNDALKEKPIQVEAQPKTEKK